MTAIRPGWQSEAAPAGTVPGAPKEHEGEGVPPAETGLGGGVADGAAGNSPPLTCTFPNGHRNGHDSGRPNRQPEGTR